MYAVFVTFVNMFLTNLLISKYAYQYVEAKDTLYINGYWWFRIDSCLHWVSVPLMDSRRFKTQAHIIMAYTIIKDVM